MTNGKKKKKKSKKKKQQQNETMVVDGYQVLGDVTDKSKTKVQRVLPRWLQNPEFVEVDLSDHQMPVDQMPGRLNGLWL